MADWPSQENPPGTVIYSAAIKTPSGYLKCDGTPQSPAAYGRMFAEITSQQTGTLTSGSNSITGLTDTTDWQVGWPIAGPGIPVGAIIAGISSGTAITISANALASGAQPLFAAPFGAAQPTVTITVASPGVLTTPTAHGLAVGDRVSLATTGALPTGLSANTVYYVQSVPSATTFTLAATAGGTAISTSGTQSGTHTIQLGAMYLPPAPGRSPMAAGTGALSSTLSDNTGFAKAGAPSGASLTARKLGFWGGEETHVLTSPGEIPSHSHGVTGSPSVSVSAHGHNIGGHNHGLARTSGNGNDTSGNGVPPHNGAFNNGFATDNGNNGGTDAPVVGVSVGVGNLGTGNTGSSGGHNTVGPTIILNAFIKL